MYMIDLRTKKLPESIIVDSVEYPIHTDFRIWIEFERSLREDHIALFDIFDCTPPEGVRWVESAREFLASPNSTPREGYGPKSDERAFDFVQDGAYIVGAFQQAYGIDLTTADIHWHRFKALFDSLPDDTKLSTIMGHRTWQSSKKKPDEIHRECKRAWTLPDPDEDKQLEAAKDAAAALYEMLGGEQDV